MALRSSPNRAAPARAAPSDRQRAHNDHDRPSFDGKANLTADEQGGDQRDDCRLGRVRIQRSTRIQFVH